MNEVLEYLFFTQTIADKFIAALNEHNLHAQVDPDVMGRMLRVITTDELNTFVDTIVRSVETPDDSPICKRL